MVVIASYEQAWAEWVSSDLSRAKGLVITGPMPFYDFFTGKLIGIVLHPITGLKMNQQPWLLLLGTPFLFSTLFFFFSFLLTPNKFFFYFLKKDFLFYFKGQNFIFLIFGLLLISYFYYLFFFKIYFLEITNSFGYAQLVLAKKSFLAKWFAKNVFSSTKVCAKIHTWVWF